MDERNDFAVAFNYSRHYLSLRMRLGLFRCFYRDRKAKDSIQICKLVVVEQYVDDAIKHCRYDGVEKNPAQMLREGKYTVLKGLAQKTSNRVKLRDELMNILLAGRDTAASLLSNLFFMLTRNPKFWAKLRKEVDTLEGRLPIYEELCNLKYLKYCLNECKLHLYSLLTLTNSLGFLQGGPFLLLSALTLSFGSIHN